MRNKKQHPVLYNGKSLKKFSQESLDSIFKENIATQSQYKPREISLTLQSALCVMVNILKH